jgi:polar amino acid transport system substrate-binding protein
MFLIRLFALALFLSGCSCGSSKNVMRIGVDTKWYPLDFGLQTAYVNGYTEDLLLELAAYSGMHFQLIPANWDTLQEGLKNQKYDALFTSSPKLESTLAKYDFSQNILNLGPVLIVPVDSDVTALSQMKSEGVGIILNDPAALILEKYPNVYIRTYDSIPELLDAVTIGEIQAALLPNILAINFVKDLYQGRLKLQSAPMTDEGLRLMAPKGKISRFNRALDSLIKKKSLETLLKKWALAI